MVSGLSLKRASGLAALLVLMAVMLLIFFLAPPARAQGETGEIVGHVIAADTGLPLEHAEVRAYTVTETLADTCFSDIDGNYRFPALEAGTYTVFFIPDDDLHAMKYYHDKNTIQ
jgi:hypothetical protein